MSCREEVSYEVMRKLDVDYVLVIFGGLIGYSGDDINKFLWMIRIGQGVYPNDIKESNFFTPRGEYKVRAPPRRVSASSSASPFRLPLRLPHQVKDLDNLGRNMTIAARYDAGDKEADALRREQQKRSGKRRSHLVA